MRELSRGDVVGIPYRGVRHEGLVVEPGTAESARVVHSSKRRRRVVEETARDFAAGRELTVIGRAPHPAASAAYARACIGRPWTYADNCQTFTREVSGLSISSPDASRVGWGALAAVAAVAFFGARLSRR